MSRIGIAIALTLLSTSAAFAWCEVDCVAVCMETAGNRYREAVARCVREEQCARFDGGTCEPDRRARRIASINRVRQNSSPAGETPRPSPCIKSGCLFKGF